GREFLAHKAAIHRAEINRVDIGRRDPRIGQRGLRHLDDKRLDVPALMLAEFAVRPTDDATAHAALQHAVCGPYQDRSLCSSPIWCGFEPAAMMQRHSSPRGEAAAWVESRKR